MGLDGRRKKIEKTYQTTVQAREQPYVRIRDTTDKI